MICREFALSRSKLHRIMGVQGALAAMIRRLRLERAYREIAADGSGANSLTDIALRVGFTQKRSFRRAFRQAFGYTPNGLRDRTRGGEGNASALPQSGAD